MTKALGATATSIPIRGAAGRRWAVICCILIVISLQFGMNRQFIFDLVSSSASAIQDNMVIWGSTTGRSITTRSPSILKQIDDLFGKRIIDDVDNLSEIRPDGVAIYPGAREWYTYWTHASQKGKPIDIFLVDDESAHIYDDYVASTVESVSEATLRHIQDMKSRYASVAALPDFYARGLGWVMDRLDMVLTLVVAGDFAPIDDAGNDPLPFYPGRTTVFIVDTVGKRTCGGGGNDDESWIDAQPPLTMWVRANGKSPIGEGEIFAGAALPHRLQSSSSQCAWRYDFEPTYPGTYLIHVKVLNFNGFFDSLSQPCTIEQIPSRGDQFDGQTVNASIPGELETLNALNYEFVSELAEKGNYLHHRGLAGFKMYDPEGSCCDACKRSRNCKMFTVPGATNFDQCELYFDRIQDDLDFLDRNGGHFLGRERNYSYLSQDPSEFPSIRRRGRHRHLVVSGYSRGWWTSLAPYQGFPPPTSAGTVSYFIGCGWSSTMTYESPCHYPSDDLVFGSGQNIEIRSRQQNQVSTTVDVASSDVRACNLDDEKLDVSNGRWVRHVYPDESVCLPEKEFITEGFRMHMLEYHGDDPPLCWHRDDLTLVANDCAEGGCHDVIGHRWKTELKNESKWFGMWEASECEYFHMGDSEIQQCIDRRNISSISLQGASISAMLHGVMTQKLQNINMTIGGKSVILSTLKMPHLLWHLGIQAYLETLDREYPSVLDDTSAEHYWVTGFFYTSEREPHVQVDRSLQYSKMAHDVLSLRGYKMINAFDVTSAFAYDTDGQSDGLHIGGPPLKAILTKFFHHLCNDVL